MEHLPVFRSENTPVGDKLKGKDVAVGVPGRKKLAEITNLPCVPKMPSQSDKMQTISLSAKDFIHQLQNENMGLKKAVMDKNKLIESSRVEIHKLTVSLEKVQLQNVQLAQSNSQLLQELNSGKDRLKALQHELGCKNGLLKALKFKGKGLPAASQENLDKAEINKTAKEGAPAQPVNNNDAADVQDEFSPPDCKRQPMRQSLRVSAKVGVRTKDESLEAPSVESLLSRRQSMRLKSVIGQTSDDVVATNEPHVPICPVNADQAYESTSGAPDLSVRKVGVKTKAVNQNSFSRRQSRRFKLDITQTREGPCEIGEVQPLAETARDGDSKVSKSTLKEENTEIGLPTRSEVSHRHSTRRPSRHAAVKIQSYKEVPLNVKMRRND